MNAETIADYVARKGITVDILRDRGTQVDADGWEHHAYELVVCMGEARLETPWRQGMGIETSPTDEPASVFDSLVRDAAGYVDYFEGWAEDYGLDTDSRRAEEMWRQVGTLTEALRALLGDDFSYVVESGEVEGL